MSQHPGSQDFAQQIAANIDTTNAARADFLQVQAVIAARYLPHDPFTDEDRAMLVERGLALRKLAPDVYKQACHLMKPGTILRWDRAARQAAREAGNGQDAKPAGPGRPSIAPHIVALILSLARDNITWGYLYIVNALHHMGITISKSTVANILRRNGISPAPERRRTGRWMHWLYAQGEIAWCGDFAEWKSGWSLFPTTIHALIFVHVKTRQLVVAGVTRQPDAAWVAKVTKPLLSPGGAMEGAKLLVLDGDPRFKGEFADMLKDDSLGRKVAVHRAWHPNQNALAERMVRTLKEYLRGFCMGEGGLRYALHEIATFYNHERPHQGLDGAIPLPDERAGRKVGMITHDDRLGGLLRYYYRETG